MGSDATDPRIDEDVESAEEEADGTVATTTASDKKRKVRKRISKAEREKFKREKFNELFDQLAGVLELTEQTNGKACILREAIKLVNNMLSDIQGLRKGNAALLSESQYLTAEKNELEDEKSVLETQIKGIQTEIDERISRSRPELNQIPPECWEPEPTSDFAGVPPLFQPVDIDPTFQQPPFLGPVYIIPAGPDLQAYSEPEFPTFQQPPFLGPVCIVPAGPDLQAYSEPELVTANPPSKVSKPLARHPTSDDPWTLQLLSK
ncbi:Transcription factor bHLH47-like protein [Drosera capensis]